MCFLIKYFNEYPADNLPFLFGIDNTLKLIKGTPLEALCGHVWVPSRDPRQLPVCPRCKEVYDLYRSFNDGLNETPSD